MSLRIKHQRITAIERALRPKHAQPGGQMREVTAAALDLARGMVRGKPGLEVGLGLLTGLQRALG